MKKKIMNKGQKICNAKDMIETQAGERQHKELDLRCVGGIVFKDGKYSIAQLSRNRADSS